MNPASAAQAAAALRDLDRDRYFATLVVPASARDAVTALFAFAAEIAAIRERVRDPMAGEIRLQWWRDALSGQGHGEVRQNPIADCVLSAVEQYGLPTHPLLQLIEARRFDLYQDPMPDLEAFEGYAGETVSVLHQLAALIVGGGEAAAAADAAGHLGVAQALVGHLGAFGYNAARGRVFLPVSVLTANGVPLEQVLAGEASPGLLAARAQWLDLAVDHAAKAKHAIRRLPPSLRSPFAAAALLPAQLRRLAAAQDLPFSPAPELADWSKIARLVWAAWRGV